MKKGSIDDIDLILGYYKANNFSVHLHVVNPSETLSESHVEDFEIYVYQRYRRRK